jgi:hypothetical protein
MKPGTSTSQAEVALRWAIDASPVEAAAMATPSSTRIATLPISRPVSRATAKEARNSGRKRRPPWTGE